MVWQGIANGFMLGWIYVLVALGLTLVFSIMGIVQFAHGEIYMLGAYCAYYICVILGFNLFLGFFVAALVLGLIGLVLERYLFRRFRGQVEPAMMVAIGLILFFQTTAAVGFGPEEKWLPTALPGVMTLWVIRLAWNRVLAVIVGIILVMLLFLFIQKTKTGKAMVATSQDPEAATLQGIDVKRISSLSMIIGCVLAAIAGVLMGAISQVEPYMGGFAISKGIAVIILGGLGSIPGAVIGGLVLGFIDGLVPLALNSIVASLIGFVVIILILIIKPRGLLGRE